MVHLDVKRLTAQRRPDPQEQFETEGHVTVPHVLDVPHFFGTREQRIDPTIGEVTAWRPQRGLRNADTVMLSVRQVHGTDALVLDRPIRAGDRYDNGWDAIVTNQRGVLVTVRTADCVPVLVHDPGGVVAAIHAGWRGAVAGIVPKTLRLMAERFGSRPRRLSVAIGPSVGPCCYEVDEPVLARVREFSWWRSVVKDVGPDRGMLDLRRLVARQAADFGLDVARIAQVPVCTVCHPKLFYSYRRDGKVRATMVSGIML